MAHEILQDYYLIGAVVYIDDTIIYGRNEERFQTLLDQILLKFVEFNVRLKSSKCYFDMEHIEFLGHIFSESGMQLSDERVQEIRQNSEATSLKTRLCRDGQLLPRLYQWIGSSDSFNGANKEKIQLN